MAMLQIVVTVTIVGSNRVPDAFRGEGRLKPIPTIIPKDHDDSGGAAVGQYFLDE